jgi:integrase
VGTKARLALDLLLLTGVRRSDVVKMGPQMEHDGWLRFTETKGQSRKIKSRDIPILPRLRESIEATPSGHLAYLVTAFNKLFTANGFGNWFRKRCNEAGLAHCSAHGLRKAGATTAAENGATEHQLMAIFGWETPKQAALYTRKVNRKRLAGDAMHLIEPERKLDKSVPLSGEKVSHRKNS